MKELYNMHLIVKHFQYNKNLDMNVEESDCTSYFIVMLY
jgi:hypothetical protein